jgi:hypothetical protein
LCSVPFWILFFYYHPGILPQYAVIGLLMTCIFRPYSYSNQYYLYFACPANRSYEKYTLKLDYLMVRVSILRLGSNRILCEARGFVYIRSEVRVDWQIYW